MRSTYEEEFLELLRYRLLTCGLRCSFDGTEVSRLKEMGRWEMKPLPWDEPVDADAEWRSRFFPDAEEVVQTKDKWYFNFRLGDARMIVARAKTAYEWSLVQQVTEVLEKAA